MSKSFEISSYFYPESFVLQTIDDFSDVSEMTYENEILSIEGNEEDIDNIFNEFMNYLTGLINEL
ncbi:MAG: hypothetical protein PHH98_03835 [Candidatus Gracilibacteria bacterium]|nr:hypothetical protein [Candidatus Gracilibacteria bacterium]